MMALLASAGRVHQPQWRGQPVHIAAGHGQDFAPAQEDRRDQEAGRLLLVASVSDLEARLNALEARLEEVAADAAAARHLAAARDRDLADLGVKVDANRSAINALGVQTAAGFEETRKGFAEMRAKFDQGAAGQQQIVDMLTTLISGQDGQ
jgi:hypothetical protein